MVLTLLVVNLCAGLSVQEAVQAFVTLRNGLICDYSSHSQCRSCCGSLPHSRRLQSGPVRAWQATD